MPESNNAKNVLDAQAVVSHGGVETDAGEKTAGRERMLGLASKLEQAGDRRNLILLTVIGLADRIKDAYTLYYNELTEIECEYLEHAIALPSFMDSQLVVVAFKEASRAVMAQGDGHDLIFLADKLDANDLKSLLERQKEKLTGIEIDFLTAAIKRRQFIHAGNKNSAE